MMYFQLGRKVLIRCVHVLQMYAPFNMATLGTSDHSRKRHVRMIQAVLMKRIFLTSESYKIRKKLLDFRLTSFKTI